MKCMTMTVALMSSLMMMHSYSDSITHGETTINIDFVNIGYAGNTADGSGYGAVAYNYQIGKFEVTADQWDAVRLADPNLGTASSGGFSGQQPTATDWIEAARFCNWLTSGNVHNGAYQFDSGTGYLIGVNRSAAVSTYGTVYALPSENEWYKAAYFKSDGSGYTLYATGDSIPTAGVGGVNYNSDDTWAVGAGTPLSIENNGTFDMDGNISEWTESPKDGVLDDLYEIRTIKGGYWFESEVALRSSWRNGLSATEDFGGTGFRVAAIPEPSSITLICMTGGAGYMIRRIRRQ